jgi:hypothetical protein
MFDFFKKKKNEPAQIDPKNCKHPKWTEESPDNGWRSSCVICGTKAAGSCQG